MKGADAFSDEKSAIAYLDNVTYPISLNQQMKVPVMEFIRQIYEKNEGGYREMGLETNVEKCKRTIEYVVVGIISFLIIIALVWRIQCTVYYWMDEVFNIEVSYLTAILGQRHLVDNHYIFSMGDIFNLPFVYLYYHVNGGIEGIVLFIRFVYLGLNLLLSFFFFKVFHPYLGMLTAALFGLIFISYFPMGAYTISYDTMALYFGLVSAIALSGALLKNDGKMMIYLYAAGIFHACMVYAYPLMLLSVFIIFFAIVFMQIRKEHMSFKDIIRWWMPYLFGGLTIVGLFILYVLYVGVQNIFIFDSEFSSNYLSGRILGELTQAEVQAEAHAEVSRVYRIIFKFYECLNWMYIQQKPALFFTVVMLIQWGIGLVKKGKWRLLLLPEIILVAFFTHTNDMALASSAAFAYLFCWNPFLFFYLHDDDKKIGGMLSLVFSLGAIANFIAVSFTALYPNKSSAGLYCGGVFTVIEMLLIVKKEKIFNVSIAWLIVLLMAICNISISYLVPCSEVAVKDCNYRLKKGAYKGLIVSEDTMQYEKIGEYLQQAGIGNNARIAMDNTNYYFVFLDTGTIPDSVMPGKYTFENNKFTVDNQIIEEIYNNYMQESVADWPEVIIVDKATAENYQQIKDLIWDKYYNLVSNEYNYLLYIKNSGEKNVNHN